MWVWVGWEDAVCVSARDEEKPLWWLWRKVDVRVVLCSLQSRGVVWLRPAGSEGLCRGRHVWRSFLEPAPLRTPCVDCRHLGSDVVQTLLSPSCLTSHTSYTWYVGLGALHGCSLTDEEWRALCLGLAMWQRCRWVWVWRRREASQLRDGTVGCVNAGALLGCWGHAGGEGEFSSRCHNGCSAPRSTESPEWQSPVEPGP